MYTKIFIPFTDEQIKMINASALARQFNCTSMWVGKVLRLEKVPTNKNTIKIHEAAREIIDLYEKQAPKESTPEESTQASNKI